MPRQSKQASRGRATAAPAVSAGPIFDADGRYHGVPRRSRAVAAFHLLLLAPVWIVSAVISPLVPGLLFAGILAISAFVLVRGGVLPGERRLATVSLVIALNALLMGLFLWKIQRGG